MSLPKLTFRLLSNFSWSLVSEGIGKGIFFIANIYLARVLGVKNYGLFTFAMSLTYYFWLAVDLGTNLYGIREIARHKNDIEGIINPLLTMRITAGILGFLFYLAVVWSIDIPKVNKLVFSGCGIYLITYSFYPDWIFKGLEQFRFIAYASLSSSLTFILAIITLVRLKQDVALAAFLWSFSYLVGSILLFHLLLIKQSIKIRPVFGVKIWRFHLRKSLFFMLSGSLMMIYQNFPILILAIFVGNYEIGIFSAAYRIITFITSFGFLLSMAFYPVFSEIYVSNKALFYRAHRYYRIIMLAVGSVLCILSIVTAKYIILHLFGPEYKRSIRIFSILSSLIPLALLRFSFGSIILATGYHRYHFLGALSGLLIMLIVGLFFLPKYSVIGCAYTVVFGEITILFVLFLISYNTFLQKGTSKNSS